MTILKGLIFDLDGTLVDSLPGIARALNQTMRDRGLAEHSLSDVRTFVGNGTRELLRRAVKGRAAENEVDDLEAAFKLRYADTWREGTSFYDGILPLLSSLKCAGHPLAVLSNKPHSFTVEMVEAMFPQDLFQVILGQRPGFPLKPDPAGNLEVARRFSRSVEECVMIGDSTMDIEAGKRAGMATVAVTWGYHDASHVAAVHADAVVESPEQLEQWLCAGSLRPSADEP